MNLQILKDNLGNQTGVFVPMEDWKIIKTNYPDIETIDSDLSQAEKDFIDARLDIANKYPERLKPINELFNELNKKI